jgi:hypothetical protein
MRPGDIVLIKFVGQTDYEQIQIGVTGAYLLDIGTEIKEIILTDISDGYMEYTYEYSQRPGFEEIADAEIIDVPVAQFIG